MLEDVLGRALNLTSHPVVEAIVFAFVIAGFFPSLSAFVRRLHDVGYSMRWVAAWLMLVTGFLFCSRFDAARNGDWKFVAMITGIGGLLFFLIISLSNSKPGANRYGPNPKEVVEKEAA